MTYPSFTTGEVLTAADMNAVGLWKVGTGSATAQNRLNVSSCFSDDYAVYRVVVTNLTHSTANNLILRFSASGSDTAGGNYYTQRSEVTGGGVSGVSITGSSAIFPTYANSSAGSFVSMTFDVVNPKAATPTTVIGGASRIDSATGLYMVTFSGLLNDSTSYDGISLVGNTGNITATINIYGYR